MTRINSLSPKHINANGEDIQEIFMIKIIMIREITKIGIGQIAEIEGHHTELEVSMNKVIEKDCVMSIIIEMTIEETNIEICKIIEVKILEVDTEEIIETIILEEVGVGLETDNIQIISEGMIEVVVGLEQVQEPVLIEIELDAISVGNMIISLRTVQLCT